MRCPAAIINRLSEMRVFDASRRRALLLQSSRGRKRWTLDGREIKDDALRRILFSAAFARERRRFCGPVSASGNTIACAGVYAPDVSSSSGMCAQSVPR